LRRALAPHGVSAGRSGGSRSCATGFVHSQRPKPQLGNGETASILPRQRLCYTVVTEMSSPPSRPLVTLVVTCFNQQAFIASALKGALAQTYRPLEMVVVDDASTDNSRAIITESLRCIPAGITVIRQDNARNQGRLGNVPVIARLANGELIVQNDGDDISHPDRVSRIVAAWQADGMRARLIQHGVRKIDSAGVPLGYMHAHAARFPLGAAMAVDRACYTDFGPILDGAVVQDETLARRALMLGPDLRLDEPLLDYRLGTGISSRGKHARDPMIRCTQAMFATFRQVRADLTAARARLGEDVYRAWHARLDREESETRACLALMTGKDFTTRLAGWRRFPHPAILSPTFALHLLFLLPRRLGDFLIDALKAKHG